MAVDSMWRTKTALGIEPFLHNFLMPLTILQKKDILTSAEELQVDTHFTLDETRLLLLKLWYTTNTTMNMDRFVFRDILHGVFNLTDDILMDRIFRVFDQDVDGFINGQEWIRGLSVFIRGTRSEQVSFSFQVYDLNNDGVVSRDELFTLLRGCVDADYLYPEDYQFSQKYMTEKELEHAKKTITSPQDEADEVQKDLVDLIFRKLDQDRDGRISLQDFAGAVKKDELLLSVLGKAVASSADAKTFLSLLDQYIPEL